MPPKKNDANKKTQDKQKAKIVEDKTFGLKNKKGAKQQKFIQTVVKQVQNKGPANAPRSALDPNAEREKKKEEERKQKEELAALFKPVAQTVAKGVDPKSVVCVYFKQGTCQKGDRCKFSHDLSIERKAEKRNVYEDTRSTDTMENWDEQKLEDVVNQKHGEDNIKKSNQTQIVCKYFLESVENKTYGWFWACPNGDKCMYRHALPPGFTLKSDMKAKEKGDEISLEMLIEKERASLGQGTTKVTLESFLAWKARKLLEKKEEKTRQESKKKADFKLGFHNGLSGRDLFTFNPDLIAADDDDADDGIDYRRRVDEEGSDQMIAREVRDDFFASEAREADGSGTVVTEDRFSYLESMLQEERDEAAASNLDVVVEDMEAGGDEENANADEDEENDDLTEEEHKKSMQNIIKGNVKLDKSSDKNPLKSAQKNGKIEIDESLFNLDDLADIEDELEDLDI